MGVRVKGISTVDGTTVEKILEGKTAEELASRVTDLEGRVTDLEGEVATQQAKIEDHENRIVALETPGRKVE